MTDLETMPEEGQKTNTDKTRTSMGRQPDEPSGTGIQKMVEMGAMSPTILTRELAMKVIGLAVDIDELRAQVHRYRNAMREHTKGIQRLLKKKDHWRTRADRAEYTLLKIYESAVDPWAREMAKAALRLDKKKAVPEPTGRVV